MSGIDKTAVLDFANMVPGYYGKPVIQPDGTFAGVKVNHIKLDDSSIYWCGYFESYHPATAWRMAFRSFPSLRRLA